MLVGQLGSSVGDRPRGQPWIVVPCPGLVDRVLEELPPPLSPALSSLLLECSAPWEWRPVYRVGPWGWRSPFFLVVAKHFNDGESSFVAPSSHGGTPFVLVVAKHFNLGTSGGSSAAASGRRPSFTL